MTRKCSLVITHGRALLTGCCRYIYIYVCYRAFCYRCMDEYIYIDVYYRCNEARSGWRTKFQIFFFRWKNYMIDVYCIVPGGTIFLLWGEFVTFRFSHYYYIYAGPLIILSWLLLHCVIYNRPLYYLFWRAPLHTKLHIESLYLQVVIFDYISMYYLYANNSYIIHNYLLFITLL